MILMGFLIIRNRRAAISCIYFIFRKYKVWILLIRFCFGAFEYNSSHIFNLLDHRLPVLLFPGPEGEVQPERILWLNHLQSRLHLKLHHFYRNTLPSHVWRKESVLLICQYLTWVGSVCGGIVCPPLCRVVTEWPPQGQTTTGNNHHQTVLL